ncbi:virion structural protein [Pseudomonas phage PA1C]|uniref:Virion structural protein n=2 Tax=root TaxID=1 RepID=A0A5C1K7H0_9CAUD|nr:internal head protein [Pseudomonas phage vB_PaeM_PS119XW]QBX32255.1 virion structural protein [Pseudomonas phage PA1C]QEM41830.1 hypothetical protein [Pseudomonas phage vB_PaeM_PS119XW]
MDTRQNPANRPQLKDSPQEELPDMIVNDHEQEFKDLFEAHIAIEAYLDQLTDAGRDGLSLQTRKFMAIGLEHIDRILGKQERVSIEALLTDPTISQESLVDRLKEVGRKILELIEKIIDEAKLLAQRVISGISSTEKKTEELLKLAQQSSNKKASMEFHDNGTTITVNGASKLFAGSEFCLDDFKAETTVMKFFINTYPKYLVDNINRLCKSLKSYDVETGDITTFEANSEFIGKHTSIIHPLKDVVLPGNYVIHFRDVSLLPMVIHDEDMTSGPETYEHPVRSRLEIQKTLKQNLVVTNSLGELFKEEAKVLEQMKCLTKDLIALEDRRGETVWKRSRDALDRVSSIVMDLIPKLRPNYGPIVARINAITNIRNKVCELELSATS